MAIILFNASIALACTFFHFEHRWGTDCSGRKVSNKYPNPGSNTVTSSPTSSSFSTHVSHFMPFLPFPHLLRDIFPGTLPKQWMTFPSSDSPTSGKKQLVGCCPLTPSSVNLLVACHLTGWSFCVSRLNEVELHEREMSPSNVSIVV